MLAIRCWWKLSKHSDICDDRRARTSATGMVRAARSAPRETARAERRARAENAPRAPAIRGRGNARHFEAGVCEPKAPHWLLRLVLLALARLFLRGRTQLPMVRLLRQPVPYRRAQRAFLLLADAGNRANVEAPSRQAKIRLHDQSQRADHALEAFCALQNACARLRSDRRPAGPALRLLSLPVASEFSLHTARASSCTRFARSSASECRRISPQELVERA